MLYNAIDLFCGCGGMTEGLIKSGFRVVAAIEIDHNAAETYRANHSKSGVKLFETDIRNVKSQDIADLLGNEPLHLLAGCPPCQGFSALRCKNKKEPSKDPRNSLILEYLRMVEELQPITIMLENVPGIRNYTLFKQVLSRLKQLGYNLTQDTVNVADYGVPQRRKRFVMFGSLLEKIDIPKGEHKIATVKDYIGGLESVAETTDPIHQRYSHHSAQVMARIHMTPHDGGSRKDLPEEYTLPCHKKAGVGFNDVYGRLCWNDVSPTITGGCLNPSKGRFLHPEEDRGITAREAALLQTFPQKYIFPVDLSLTSLALMIGNALPPLFCKAQAQSIRQVLDVVFTADIYDKNKRSEIMHKVKNKNTEPEMFIRKLLTEMGYKYRLKTSKLHCKPDIVFPSRKKVIFVNGCFWHGHNCRRGSLPKTNEDFWRQKITRNKNRDIKNYEECLKNGWKYLIIWQCQIKISNSEKLKSQLREFLN